MNRPILAAAIPTSTAVVFYFYLLYPTRSASHTPYPSPAHFSSFGQKIVNPRRLSARGDAFTVKLPVSTLQPGGITNEEILARFTKGFFGGWAFFLEGTFFWITGKRITNIMVSRSGLEIWSRRKMSRESIPKLGTLYFGNFRLLDSSFAPVSERATFGSLLDGKNSSLAEAENKGAENGGDFVELGFGKPLGTFSGSHRFEVRRERWKEGEEGDEKDELVILRLSGMNTNPTKEGEFLPSWMNIVHQAYARCLFANGMNEVLKR